MLTIAGERLELSRFLPPSPVARAAFAAILAVIVAGLLGARTAWGAPVFGGGLLALALWLLQAGHRAPHRAQQGLTRFIAVCLLSGYVWLAIGGAVIVAAGGLAPGSPAYDAALHALRWASCSRWCSATRRSSSRRCCAWPCPTTRRSTARSRCCTPRSSCAWPVMRRAQFDWTRAGGLLNALALAAFILSTVSAVVRGKRRPAPPANTSGG